MGFRSLIGFMKYKNIVFDFGNVIGRFSGRGLLRDFCSDEKDIDFLLPILFDRWAEVDKGTFEYEDYSRYVLNQIPERLIPSVKRFLKEWPSHLEPMEDTHQFIRELKDRGIPIYLLSNAPDYFAEWAKGYEIISYFDGVVFSGPLKMAKPEPEIYRYLFDTFSLKPEECFFLDDKEENILAGQALGMDGIIFTGDIDTVKRRIDF